MHRHRNLGGRSSPATAVSPRTLASFERRSESVSQCTGSFSLSSSRTGAPECPITRVILVCNKPAPRCQGGGDHPRRITSRRWSHLRTHMLLMEYHLCFTPFPENVHTSIPPPPFDLLQPLWHPLPTALSLYIHLIRPWLSRRKLLLDPCLFTLPFLFPLFFFFFTLPDLVIFLTTLEGELKGNRLRDYYCLSIMVYRIGNFRFRIFSCLFEMKGRIFRSNWFKNVNWWLKWKKLKNLCICRSKNKRNREIC